MINISNRLSVSSIYGRQTRSADVIQTGKADTAKTDGIKSEATDESPGVSKIKNTSSLPDEVFENIQRLAKEDAKKNIYMDNEFVAYINNYKAQHISPDRSRLMMMLNPMIANAQYTNGQPTFFSLLDFTVRFSVGAMFGAYVSVRDSSGEEILTYSPSNGRWVSLPTKAENQFHDEATGVYYAAFEEARAEIRAQEAGGAGSVAMTGFNATV